MQVAFLTVNEVIRTIESSSVKGQRSVYDHADTFPATTDKEI